MTKNKEQKDFYNFIRQVYKKKPDIGEIPDFMKVYYEIERVHNFEVNKFYYAVCNYVFLGLEPSRDIKESDDWESIEPYCIKERENRKLRKENRELKEKIQTILNVLS